MVKTKVPRWAYIAVAVFFILYILVLAVDWSPASGQIYFGPRNYVPMVQVGNDYILGTPPIPPTPTCPPIPECG